MNNVMELFDANKIKKIKIYHIEGELDYNEESWCEIEQIDCDKYIMTIYIKDCVLSVLRKNITKEVWKVYASEPRCLTKTKVYESEISFLDVQNILSRIKFIYDLKANFQNEEEQKKLFNKPAEKDMPISEDEPVSFHSEYDRLEETQISIEFIDKTEDITKIEFHSFVWDLLMKLLEEYPLIQASIGGVWNAEFKKSKITKNMLTPAEDEVLAHHLKVLKCDEEERKRAYNNLYRGSDGIAYFLRKNGKEFLRIFTD